MDNILSIPLVLTLIFSLFLFYLFFFKPSSTKSTTIGIKHYPLLGAIPSFLHNRNHFLDWSSDILTKAPTNTVLYSRPINVHGVITSNPAVVEYILKTNFVNYPKGERLIFLLEDFLGKGIFNSDGEVWRLQRKIASYEFSKNSLRDFASDCVRFEIRERLLPLLSDAARTGRILDLQDVMERFAVDNICKLAFNVDPHCLSTSGRGTGSGFVSQPDFMQAFDQATTISSDRFFTPLPILWKIQKFLDIGSERTLRQSIRVVHEFADSIIKQRLEQEKERRRTDQNDSPPSRRLDLLSRFVETDELNSPTLLRDIVISFILAGRDTTSSALTWFFWQLSSKPEILRNIRSEVNSFRTKPINQQVGSETQESERSLFSYEEIQRMNYLHAAISESMRLYPPVPLDEKLCLTDDVLPDGTKLRKGAIVTYHSYAMGRMEGIWGKDFMEFKPERWLDEQSGVFKMESPFKYPVFHAGPRICLGKDLAYIQMKSIVAAMVERFDVEVVSEEQGDREYVLSATMRVKGGLHVRIRERSD